MNYKNFPDEYWKKLEESLKDLQKKSKPIYAAFDADGTLWDTDLGENFFNYQIEQKQVELPVNPWEHYLNLKKINNDPRAGYVWLAQINKGQSVSQVKKWAEAAFSEIQPSPIFSEQKKLIELFKKYKVQIYIVTASIKWAVEPGAMALGLTPEQVIGVETEVHEGVVTDFPVLPITYRQGKAQAFLQKTNKVRPFFSSGNTIGDFELLELATHFKLAVSAASRDDKLFKSEDELLKKAKENNWWSHRFI